MFSNIRFTAVALFTVFCLALVFAISAFAQSADVPVGTFVDQVFAAVKAMGGLSTAGKVASAAMLVVASMKVSVLRQWVWDKLGAAQVLVGPVLGLVAGALMYFTAGVPLTIPSAVAWLLMGGGSILLHELLDGLKGIPGLGGIYVTVIDFIMNLLGAQKAPPAAQ